MYNGLTKVCPWAYVIPHKFAGVDEVFPHLIPKEHPCTTTYMFTATCTQSKLLEELQCTMEAPAFEVQVLMVWTLWTATCHCKHGVQSKGSYISYVHVYKATLCWSITWSFLPEVLRRGSAYTYKLSLCILPHYIPSSGVYLCLYQRSQPQYMQMSEMCHKWEWDRGLFDV